MIRWKHVALALALATAPAVAQDITTGLLVRYSMDSGDLTWGTNSILDTSGNTAHATAVNMDASNQVSGQLSGGLSFNGTNERLSVGLNLSSYNAVTVGWWMYKSSFTTDDRLAFEFTNNFNSSTGGFVCNPNASAGAQLQISVKGSGYNTAAYTPPSTGAWHHYVAIYDKSLSTNEVSLYIDGSLATPASRATNTNNINNFASSTLYIASRAGTTLFHACQMDEFRLYTRALSAADVSALYAYTGLSLDLKLIVNHLRQQGICQ